MTSNTRIPVPLPSAANSLAAFLVLVPMIILYLQLSGSTASDWDGYASLYSANGAWLFDQGRDAGFVWLINKSYQLFGSNGYEDFRTAVFLLFVMTALFLACSMPPQRFARGFGSLACAMIVLTAFILKAFVQIREGLSFVFIVTAVLCLLSRSQLKWYAVFPSLFFAISLHISGIFLVTACLLSCTIVVVAPNMVTRISLGWTVLVVSILAGAILGFLAIEFSDLIRLRLKEYGVDETAQPQSSFYKYLYWLTNGVITLLISDRLRNSSELSAKNTLSASLRLTLSSIVLPFVFTFAVFLVVSDFPTPAFTAMIIRLFYSASELCLLLIALSGRVSPTTMIIATFMVVDRLRLVLSAS